MPWSFDDFGSRAARNEDARAPAPGRERGRERVPCGRLEVAHRQARGHGRRLQGFYSHQLHGVPHWDVESQGAEANGPGRNHWGNPLREPTGLTETFEGHQIHRLFRERWPADRGEHMSSALRMPKP